MKDLSKMKPAETGWVDFSSLDEREELERIAAEEKARRKRQRAAARYEKKHPHEVALYGGDPSL
jgi:hypothetical protein